jgi:hypothetical protein
MYVYPASSNILENPVVSGWLSPHIMMFGETVHRNCHSHFWDFHPFQRNRNHGTRYHHGMNIHAAQDRQHATQFAMPNQWLASNERDMQRTMLPN